MGTSKDVAWAYFERLGAGELDEAAALLHDDGTWWTCGSRRTISMAEHKELFPKAMAMVHFSFVPVSSIEEGDHVMLELESDAAMPDGTPYHNVYSFVITVRDGLLLDVREYSDTAYVASIAPSLKALYVEG